jgi:putative aldouronate transport system permease protein
MRLSRAKNRYYATEGEISEMTDTALDAKRRVKTSRKNRIKRFMFGDAVILALLSVLALTILYPFYNAVLVSFVPNTIYLRHQGVMLIPPKITLDAYDFTFKSKLIWTGYRNTILVTFFGTSYNMILTILCAYAMTKPFPGRKLTRFIIVFTIYFTGGLIPYYLLIKSLNIMDTMSVMILPMGLNIMFMLIISEYFSSIPSSLEESAKIDGAGDFTVLVRIILPLSLPLLATFTLYYAVDRWNEWYHAMLFVKSASRWPLQNILRTIINDVNYMATQNIPGQQRPDIQGDAIKVSSIIVSMVPMMCMYPFLQRYFLSGLTLGAVKE